MPEKNKKYIKDRWAAILSALGLFFYYYGISADLKVGIMISPKTESLALVLLFAALMLMSGYGWRMTVLRVFTLLIAVFLAVIYSANVNVEDISPAMTLGIAVLKSVYVFIYISLLEKIAVSYDSDREIPLHIARNFSVTVGMLNVVLPLLLESYSIISAFLMMVFLSIIGTVIFLFITYQILRLGKDIRTAAKAAEA